MLNKLGNKLKWVIKYNSEFSCFVDKAEGHNILFISLISPLKQLLRTNSIISVSNGEEEAAVSPPDPSDPIKTALTRTEDTKNEARTR